MTDEQFSSVVWDALKGDHNDLRRQQIILEAHRSDRTNNHAELVEALREIAAGVEKRMHDGTTVVDDHPDAMEIARKALSLYGGEK